MNSIFGKRFMALVLTTVIMGSYLLSGCAADQGAAGGSDSSAPAALNERDSRYAVEVDESDAPSAEAIQYLLSLQRDSVYDMRFFWLDSETLTREVAYANALVDAYKEGTCPNEVIEEAEFLAYLKTIVEFDAPDMRPGVGFFVRDTNYLWEIVIAELDNVYQYIGHYSFKGLDKDEYAVSLTEVYEFNFADSLEMLLDDYTKEIRSYCFNKGQEQPIIDGVPIPEPNEELKGTPYAAAALLHEACCKYDHSQVNEYGYTYCSSLDEYEAYRSYGGDSNVLRGPGWSLADYIKDAS